MQGWQNQLHAVHAQGALVGQQARAYMQQRTAPPAVYASVAAATINATHVHAGPAGHLASGVHHVMQCSCAHGCCYKVLLVSSVVKALHDQRADPLACPACAAHAASCRTYSKHVEDFLAAARGVLPACVVVWDWIDVPGLQRAHWDATLVMPGGGMPALRFEIDSVYHVNAAAHARLAADVVKDGSARQNAVCVLRLHESDKATWGAYVLAAWQGLQQCVWYTAAYAPYLTQLELQTCF